MEYGKKESKTLEFKSAFTRSFLKTVSAYANFGSGDIVFGVSDDGQVIGVEDAQRLCMDIENTINDSVSPRPRYTLETKARQDKKLVVLHVFEGKDKPYLYKAKAYRRSNTADVQVSPIELNRLLLEGQNTSFEEVMSKDQELDFSCLADHLRNRAGVDHLDKNVLKTLRLYSSPEGYNNAAALLADENIFPGVDIVRFGNSVNEILDRQRCIGVSILKQLNYAMEMFERYYVYEVIEGAIRQRVERVPLRAYREAVANSLVHRLWDVQANIQISMHDDGILVSSPGGLPTGISEEDYLEERVSVLRNPIIANVFYRLDYVEIFGTGIEKIRESYDPYSVSPEFAVSDNTISVKLPVIDISFQGLTLEEEKVLQLFSPNLLLSRAEVEQQTRLSQAKAGRIINSLIAKGALQRVGNGRAARYRRAESQL